MLVTKPAFTTTNSLIAVSVPEKRDTQVKFDDFGIAEVSNQKEFCILTVLFDSDCGYRKGQTVYVEGDLVKHQYKVYTVDGVTFTLISKDLVRGFIKTQEQITEELNEKTGGWWSDPEGLLVQPDNGLYPQTPWVDPWNPYPAQPWTIGYSPVTGTTTTGEGMNRFNSHLVVKPDPEDGA